MTFISKGLPKRVLNSSIRGSGPKRWLSVSMSKLDEHKIADPSEESQTGQYIHKVTVPYTVTTYSRPNLIITQGKGSYLYDLEDRKYVDFVAGIAVTALGHSNPDVSDIISKQSKILLHCSNLYYNFYAGELCNKIVSKTIDSGGMKDAQRVFLCNSGTEANEAALKFSRKYGKSLNPSKTEFISFENSFHGRSMGALSVTPNKKYQAPFAPLIPGIKTAKINDIESVRSVISKDKTCAVIIEPIQGEGGVVPVEEEFLIQLRKLCSQNDALLIYDEIQCGLGRSGKLWAHSHFAPDAHPDIVTMAKALGNGFPIGAVMITEKVEKSLKIGDHGTTFGGNPLGSRVGSYVVDQVSDPAFLKKVNQKSARLLDGLNKIKEKYPDMIEDIRGKGLLLGVKFNQKYDVNDIVNDARKSGLLVVSAGMNVLRLIPALNIPDDVIDEGLSLLESSISRAGVSD